MNIEKIEEHLERTEKRLQKIKDAEKQRLELARQIQNEKFFIGLDVKAVWLNMQSNHKEYLDKVSSLLLDWDLEPIINELNKDPKIIKHPNAKNTYYLANSIEGVFYRAYKKEFSTLGSFVSFFAKEIGEDVKLSQSKERITIGNKVFGVCLDRKINYYDRKVWELITFWELRK